VRHRIQIVYELGRVLDLGPSSVADLDPFDTDPDPAFHFDMYPYPSFQFDTDPDLTVRYRYRSGSIPFQRDNVPTTVLFIHLYLIFPCQ
jgi:hypothetical protein